MYGAASETNSSTLSRFIPSGHNKKSVSSNNLQIVLWLV